MDESSQYLQGEDPSRWIDEVILHAINNRASDIHLEAQEGGFGIRVRIDGILYPIEASQKYTQQSITSRIKVLAAIDLTEHRLPQDGHMEYQHQGIIYNIRVSVMPTSFGETIVFRIFNRQDILLSLDSLGFESTQLTTIQHLLTSPSGMLLTTGPSGSGKTTLLYSILHSLNSQSRNIVTLEDPIEFQMHGIRQTQVNEAIGLTFARAMRSVVRQDADIVMLGEIRDAESAQLAMQAALTGTLVFSTFHTYDVPALVIRFMEFGISNSELAQSVMGVISTRLVRKICFSCKEEYQPTDAEKTFLGSISPAVLQKGRGCQTCQNKGYLGRTGIFEVVTFDNDIKASIIDRKPAAFIYELLQKKQIMSLKQAATKKLLEGVTTSEEVIRVVGSSPE